MTQKTSSRRLLIIIAIVVILVLGVALHFSGADQVTGILKMLHGS